MNTSFIFTLVVSFAILYIGIVTTFHNKKSVTNRLYALISISTVLWSLVNYFSLYPVYFESITWIRLVLFFAIPHIVFFYFFTKNFPSEKLLISKKELFLVSFFSVLMMVFSLTPLIFKGVHAVGMAQVPDPGILIPVFGFFVVSMLSLSIRQLVKKYISADEKDRKAWFSMLVGFILSYTLLIVTNFFLINITGNTKLILFAPLFMIPAILGPAYSIVKYRVLHVKAIATEFLVFVLLSVTLIQLFTSDTPSRILINSLLFCVFLVIGIFLTRSVIKEVEQREKLELVTSELEKANEKLKSLDKLKTEFLSLASHQLRSPLTAIKGYTSMLLEGSFGNVNDSQKEAIDRVFQSSQHLTKVVEDLLNVTKIEQGGMQYVFESTDIEITTNELVRELAVTASKKGLKLSFVRDNTRPYMVNVDAEKLRQVILNFIDNAIKYTEEGSITVSMNHVGKEVAIAISDTGAGISPETKVKLFGKFNRGEASTMNTGGSGLGLYLAKEIIKAHNGRIEVDSPGIGKGSTFTIYLATSN